MKPKLYLETTIASYLVAKPSHDLVRAAHQQVTRDWWDTRGAFGLYISQLVLDEAAAGDPDAANRRLAVLQDLVLLDLTDATKALAGDIVGQGGVPSRAYVDAIHVALSAVHGMDYLLTWNCKHIANPATRGKIEAICRASGFEPPVICTPVEFTEE